MVSYSLTKYPAKLERLIQSADAEGGKAGNNRGNRPHHAPTRQTPQPVSHTPTPLRRLTRRGYPAFPPPHSSSPSTVGGAAPFTNREGVNGVGGGGWWVRAGPLPACGGGRRAGRPDARSYATAAGQPGAGLGRGVQRDTTGGRSLRSPLPKPSPGWLLSRAGH